LFEASLRAGLGDDYLERIDAERAGGWGPAYGWRQIAGPFRFRNAAVEKVRDIVFAEPGGKPLKLDVYRPADGRQGCPTLLLSTAALGLPVTSVNRAFR